LEAKYQLLKTENNIDDSSGEEPMATPIDHPVELSEEEDDDGELPVNQDPSE